jgi:acetylornithine deacetylase
MSPPPDVLAQAIALIARLVSFDTESSKSNLPLVEFVADYLTRQAVPFVVVPNAERSKAAIFVTIGPPIEGGIILSAHTDTVPVVGQVWTSDPFQLRRQGDRLFGRGACDMKGFAAVSLAMVEEFRHANLQRPIHILLSYDEETTCLGPVDTIARFGRDLPQPAIAIVGEPTLMQAADAHKSIATYITSVYGHEAHSAKPALGANAIASACALVTALYGMQQEFERDGDASGRFDPGYSTVHVGTIHGGTARNILAKECRFHWEFRALPGVAFDRALRRLDAYATQIEMPKLRRFTNDGRIETETEIEVPGLIAQPGSPAESLVLKLIRSNRTIAVPYATEAGRFQTAGISTIVCGPGSIDQAHQPDEYIDIAQLVDCIGSMRALAAHLAAQS